MIWIRSTIRSIKEKLKREALYTYSDLSLTILTTILLPISLTLIGLLLHHRSGILHH